MLNCFMCVLAAALQRIRDPLQTDRPVSPLEQQGSDRTCIISAGKSEPVFETLGNDVEV